MKLSQKIALASIRFQFRFLSFFTPATAARKAFKLFCTPRRKQQATSSTIMKKAEQLLLTANGYQLHGYRWNIPALKKILIIHGFESTARNFDGYVSTLIEKGFEVVAFDAQAHGKSEGNTITLPEYLHTLSIIYNKYGPFNNYIAHSFGGLALAHLLEQLPHTATTKAVLIAPATETVSAINDFFRLLQLSSSVRIYFDKIVEEKGGKPPAFYSVRRAMEHIRADVLWLHDKNDDITPFSDVEKVQNEHYANVHFIFTTGLGHRKIYRDRTIMNHIFDFL